jgi:Ca2+-binding RTX toxin-like protein
MHGDVGNDWLNGGAGEDIMPGGAGNDTYMVEDAGNVLIEELNGGIDTVQSLLASTTLGANFENLTMMYAGMDEGFGNTLANII